MAMTMMARPIFCLLLVLLLGVNIDGVEARSNNFRHFSQSHPRRTIADLPPNWEAQLDEFITNVTECTGMIGLSVSIVFDNTSIYAKGFGVTDFASQQPVNADTLFSIGSTSKAFTSTLIGMLIDEGYFAPNGWDTKVTDILTDFQFFEPAQSQFMSIRDLLSMKTGISLQPLMMLKNDTRHNNLYKFQYAAPAWEMRTDFLYHNWMINLAGLLAETVTGETWENLVIDKILTPLGMTTSTPYLDEVIQSDNYAKPYLWNPATANWSLLPPDVDLNFQRLAPAGSMSTTANDVAAWLMVHLNHGFSPAMNKSLVSSTSVDTCHTPSFLMQEFPIPATLPTNPFSNENLGYGFGWMKDSYQGHEITWHNGLIFGYNTEMVVMILDGLGIFLSQTGSVVSDITFRIQNRVSHSDRSFWLISLLVGYLGFFLVSGERSLIGIRFYIINLLLGLPNWVHGCNAIHDHLQSHPTSQPSTPSHSPITHGVNPFIVHREGPIAPTSKHHSRHHASPASFYAGTYSNIIYDNLTITDATSSAYDLVELFPAHPVDAAPITLILEWEVLTCGLSTWDGVHYNLTASSPWDLAFGAVWPNSVYFQIETNVVGLFWIIDQYAPPYFNKTA